MLAILALASLPGVTVGVHQFKATAHLLQADARAALVILALGITSVVYLTGDVAIFLIEVDIDGLNSFKTDIYPALIIKS